MKVLAAGDIHGDKSLVVNLADKAEKENVKLVILCGDVTADEEDTSGLIGPFLKKNKKVLLLPGNHDTLATTDFMAEFYGIKNIHGYSVRYEEVGLFGCGLANIGLNQLSEDEIFSTLKQAHSRIKYLKRKIMVTHVHPAQTKMEKLSDFVKGSKGVTRAIKELKPDVLFCSHIHEAEGLEEKIGSTRVINVGREGKVLDI
jgi:uncharacterized protein